MIGSSARLTSAFFSSTCFFCCSLMIFASSTMLSLTTSGEGEMTSRIFSTSIISTSSPSILVTAVM